MIGANGKILVKVDLEQKSTTVINGVEIIMASKYDNNYREKSPVLAEVIVGNGIVVNGDILLCHHNLFYLPSPHHLYDNVFSIKTGSTIFAKIDKAGCLIPLYGNVLCDRIEKKTEIPLPPEQIEKHTDKVVVTNGHGTAFKNGDILLTRPHSYYEIVYMYDGVERRVHKCNTEMVCGVVSG